MILCVRMKLEIEIWLSKMGHVVTLAWAKLPPVLGSTKYCLLVCEYWPGTVITTNISAVFPYTHM